MPALGWCPGANAALLVHQESPSRPAPRLPARHLPSPPPPTVTVSFLWSSEKSNATGVCHGVFLKKKNNLVFGKKKAQRSIFQCQAVLRSPTASCASSVPVRTRERLARVGTSLRHGPLAARRGVTRDFNGSSPAGSPDRTGTAGGKVPLPPPPGLAPRRWAAETGRDGTRRAGRSGAQRARGRGGIPGQGHPGARGQPRAEHPVPGHAGRGHPGAGHPLAGAPRGKAEHPGGGQGHPGPHSPSSRSSKTGLLEEEALAPILFFHLPQ